MEWHVPILLWRGDTKYRCKLKESFLREEFCWSFHISHSVFNKAGEEFSSSWNITRDWTLCTFNTHKCFCITMIKVWKYLGMFFSIWISFLMKDLSTFYKAHPVLILDPEKYIENLFSNASSRTFRQHKLVTFPSKIIRLAEGKNWKENKEKHNSILRSLFQIVQCNCEVLIISLF